MRAQARGGDAVGRCFVALAMLGVVASVTLASPTPTQRCAAAKVKAAGRDVFVTAKCYAKASAGGGAVSPDCLAKAAKRFQAAFAKADAKGGCTVVADADSLGAAAAACVTSFTGAVAGESQCASAKTKAVGKDAFAEATCRQKAFLASMEGVDPQCTAKAEAKLVAAVATADGYGSCSGDVTALGTL